MADSKNQNMKHNPKIKLKTKTSSADTTLDSIDLSQGEPLVNTNNNTVIIATQNDKKANDTSTIVLGNSNNKVGDNGQTSRGEGLSPKFTTSIDTYDGNNDTPRSQVKISAQDGLKVEGLSDDEILIGLAGDLEGTIKHSLNVKSSIGSKSLKDIFVTTTKESDELKIGDDVRVKRADLADRATKLDTARTLTVDLNSENKPTFNGTSAVTIGVQNILPIKHGGTGANTADEALSNLGIEVEASTVNLLQGTKSNIQEQINSKQPIIKGAASTVTSDNLPLSRVVVTDSNGKLSASSNITTTELGYLDGVTSKIQTQLAGKAPVSHATSNTTYGVATTNNYGHVKISNGDCNSIVTADGLVAGMDHKHSNYIESSFKTVTQNDDNSISISDDHNNTVNLVPGMNVGLSVDGNNITVSTSGEISGTVDVAKKLSTARTIRTNLSSNSPVSFNGTTNVEPGVTGTLSIANGGTGATTKSGVLTNLGIYVSADTINKLNGITDNVTNLLDTKANTKHTSKYDTYGVSSDTEFGHSKASTTSPKMNGVAHIGTETNTFARGDHIHPTDTTRAPKSHTSSTNEYGLANTAVYGHVRLAWGDVNGNLLTDGVAAAGYHTHGNYVTSAFNSFTRSNGDKDVRVTDDKGNYIIFRAGDNVSLSMANRIITIGTSGEISGTIDSAKNVTTSINGTLISNIFDTNMAAQKAIALTSNAGSSTQPIYFANGKPVACTYVLNKSVPSNAVFTDTHYTSKLVTTNSNLGTTDSTSLSNGNVWLNLVENGSIRTSKRIVGVGATTVTMADSTTIKISSTDTTYSTATTSTLGLVKSGGDVTVDTSGNMHVTDDSHNHIISNVDGLQTALNQKQNTITGAATTVTTNDLTVNRAVITDGNGKLSVSSVISTTELGYLDGVSSNIQTQLNAKSSTSHTHNYAGAAASGGAATSANKLNTDAGSDTTPVYFANGVPVACSYTISKSVPSNAVFTDTTYSFGTGSSQGQYKVGSTNYNVYGLSTTSSPTFSSISATSSVTAPNFYSTSDRRKKTNIVTYNPSKSILDLEVKEFDYIDTKVHTIGCIADELQQIEPMLVTEDTEGYLQINESKLVYLLLDEVKKLRKELNDLKKG